MTLKPLGDSAWLVEFPDGTPPAHVMRLVAALGKNRPAEVLDVVSSFASVAVHFEGMDVRHWIESKMAEEADAETNAGGDFEIPVCYDGPDLEEVAAQVGLSTDEVIALHSGADYTVAAVGFSPGFPYLSGLPQRLNVPRRKTPRLAVPAGSVAIAGGQAGIYPFTSPGGWHVLGRTVTTLFDLSHSPPALLRPGDRVRFLPVAAAERACSVSPQCLPPDSSVAKTSAPESSASSFLTSATESEALRRDATTTSASTVLDLEADGKLADQVIEVIRPGGLTTVQDLGRPGHESSGVSPGGAADRSALRMANLLVGNHEGAACLEICLSGPILKFHAAAVVAFFDGTGRPQRVTVGEVVDFSKLKCGVRAYLAVSGGFVVPSVLGSSSTDLRSRFGGFSGRALHAGDRLYFGAAKSAPRGDGWHVGRAGRRSQIELRFISGVQEGWFSAEALRRLRDTTYQLTPKSDRMGARLSGKKLVLTTPREMVSQPVVCGSVQVPPDGQPIVLMAERQTIGGYPQIAHVISMDLAKLANAWPGTWVSFREVTLEQARELKLREERDFTLLRTGLELLK